MEYVSGEMNTEILSEIIREHQNELERYDLLDRYYKGEHEILNRVRDGDYSANNKLVCNFAKYIVDTSVGYAFGNPAIYTFSNCEDVLYKTLAAAGSHRHDSELAKDLSVFGSAYELVYIKGNLPKLALIDPRNAFVVKDGSVENNAVFGVVYGKEVGKNGFSYRVYDDTTVSVYTSTDLGKKLVKVSENEHFTGGMPLIEYINNEERMGDFEHVISLIDAYNTLQSDRLNDKETFVNCVLLIQGCQVLNDESAAKMLTNRILELPYENADAKYLTKAMNESEVEILRCAIAEDIHKFSQTPDFSDKNFAGNTSGVAIKYKLLSIENLAKVKERFFVSGLRHRIDLFESVLMLTGRIMEGGNLIDIGFNRILPVNEYEIAKTIEILHGIVPEDELLRRWRV